MDELRISPTARKLIVPPMPFPRGNHKFQLPQSIHLGIPHGARLKIRLHCALALLVAFQVNVILEMLLKIRKKHIWPISQYCKGYSEDDLFDVIEFLYQNVSKPVDGTMHNYNGCGMHWETFNKKEGQVVFVEKINDLLSHYCNPFELSLEGEVLNKPDAGFETIFEADVPTKDQNVRKRIESAVLRYRRHGSTIDDRRQAVRDLADVLEYLRPKMKTLLTKSDENDLFNIANNFGIRHHNAKQKTSYDTAIWLSWMFYFYLATLHVILRKIDSDRKAES